MLAKNSSRPWEGQEFFQKCFYSHSLTLNSPAPQRCLSSPSWKSAFEALTWSYGMFSIYTMFSHNWQEGGKEHTCPQPWLFGIWHCSLNYNCVVFLFPGPFDGCLRLWTPHSAPWRSGPPVPLQGHTHHQFSGVMTMFCSVHLSRVSLFACIHGIIMTVTPANAMHMTSSIGASAWSLICLSRTLYDTNVIY